MTVWHLGNDVVDTSHRGSSGKGTDPRFLARVCVEEERDVVLSSSIPDMALWTHWAGKEAIFKSTCKALASQPPFHHPLFRVHFRPEALEALIHPGPQARVPGLVGAGSYEDLRFHISVERRGRAVHAVSWMGGTHIIQPQVHSGCVESPEDTRGRATGFRNRFSALEWECVTHRASALTRVMARRALATAHDVPEAAVEIRCGPGLPGRRIPSVWLHGRELPVDLTLSHHGRFLSWVFLSREGQDGVPSNPPSGPG